MNEFDDLKTHILNALGDAADRLSSKRDQVGPLRELHLHFHINAPMQVEISPRRVRADGVEVFTTVEATPRRREDA